MENETREETKTEYKLVFLATPERSYDSRYKKGDAYLSGRAFTDSEIRLLYAQGYVKEIVGPVKYLRHAFPHCFLIVKIESIIKVNITQCDWNGLAAELEVPGFIPIN